MAKTKTRTLTLRDKLAASFYGADWDAEGIIPEEWESYESPWKETYYEMADRAIALFVACYKEDLPIGPDDLDNCPVKQKECCGWHSACRIAETL